MGLTQPGRSRLRANLARAGWVRLHRNKTWTPQRRGPSEDVITFDLLADDSSMDDFQIIGQLTQAEEEEIANVVSVLDGVNSREVIDFSMQQPEPRHKGISNSELDQLAGKNNAITTQYQTKWAYAVFKAKYTIFSVNFRVKSALFDHYMHSNKFVSSTQPQQKQQNFSALPFRASRQWNSKSNMAYSRSLKM